MKLFNKILLGAAAIAVAGASYSCKEEATLAGADAVYITMADTDITLLVGDTLRLSATVQNASGDVIETPITWSSSDESVVKIVDVVEYEYEPNPDYVNPDDAGSPEEGETEGTLAEGEAGEGEGDVVVPEFIVKSETHYVGLVAVAGAQGKATTIKASLENGMYAMTNVSVGRNKLAGAITVYSSEAYGEGDWRHGRDGANKTTYIDQLNDTVWFRVDPIQLVDDYTIDYNVELTEVAANGSEAQEQVFKFPAEPVYIDRNDNAVGIVFTAPRLAGKASVSLTLSLNEGGVSESETCSNEILICPKISAGFAYLDAGVMRYPLYEEESPSNPKPKQTAAALDINSDYMVEVCMGIRSGREDDIQLAMAAEKAGYFSWKIDGNAVIVEDQDVSLIKFYEQQPYVSGYISYLKVKSGTREGKVRALFSVPGQDFVCDIDVIDFKKQYPVEQIIIKSGETEVGDSYEIDLSTKSLSFAVTTIPDASFSFHVPTVESSNTAVLEPVSRDGNNYVFSVKGVGTATLKFQSIDVVREVVVTVKDAIEMITIPVNEVSMYIGDKYELTATVKMFSGATNNETVEFVSTNATVASVALKSGSSNVGVVTASAIGSAEVYATLGGVCSNAVKVTVSEIEDITIVSATGNGRNGELTLNLQTGSGRVTVKLPIISTKYGQYTGNDAKVTASSVITENCAYNFSLVQGEGNAVTANGYVQMPNGLKYLLNNLTFNCQFR